MQCERCNASIAEGEERKHNYQILCEDCYLDLLSPAKSCDPWAVYSAKTFAKQQGPETHLNSVQHRILEVLRKDGPVEPCKLCKYLQIKETDMDRELASLRHMEKVRGELRNGIQLVRLWD
jgi:hypothetical protein